jgi:nucleoside-diphosphate-sugar epimerase
MRYPFTLSHYARSKAAAQEMVINAFRGSATEVTVVNPAFMIGPNDNKVSSNKIILRALGKKIVFIPPGARISFMYGMQQPGFAIPLILEKTGNVTFLQMRI